MHELAQAFLVTAVCFGAAGLVKLAHEMVVIRWRLEEIRDAINARKDTP